MKKLIDRHYEATRKRGLIDSDTDMNDFLGKLSEEVLEVNEAYDDGRFSASISEVVDVVAVCLNTLHHFGYDFEAMYKLNVEHQENRI